MNTKHTIKILMLIALSLFINGCDNGVCITPDQIYMETVSVDVWMYPDQDHEDANGWIASGMDIPEDEEVNIKVTGNGNMCGLTSETRAQNSSVPDEDLRDYIIPLDFNKMNTSVSIDYLNSSFLPKKGPNVMPGDFISISLEPIQIKINCQNPPPNVKILDYNICMNGGEIDMGSGGTRKISTFHNTMQDILYVTDKNVLGNIIYYNILAMNNINWYASSTTTTDTYRFYDLIIPVQKDLPNVQNKFPNYFTVEQISKTTEDKIPAFNLMQMQQMIDLSLIDIPTPVSTDPKNPKGMLLYKTLMPMLLPESAITGSQYQKPTSALKNLDTPNGNLIKLNEKIPIKEKGMVVIAATKRNIKGGAKIKITRDCSDRALNSIYITASDKMTSKSEPLQPNQKIIKLTSLTDLSAKYGATANTDATHSYSLPKNTLKGYIYIKTDRSDDTTYLNNTGKYTLKISKPRRFSGTISKGISDIKDAILDMVDGKLDQNGNRIGGAGHEMYQAIIRNPTLKSLIYALLTLYITLKGIKYMSGIEPLTKENVIMSAIKASVVISIINPTTFGIIRDFFHRICIDGLDFLINSTTSFDTKFTTKTDFSFMDSSLGRFTIHETGIQMLALFVSGPVGWVVLLAIIVSICIYGFTVLMSAVLYLMNIILISFLIALLPLFTLTILFKFTSKIFHTWIKVLITNILKPILLFISLAILNQLMMAALFNVFNFTVCDDCALGFQLIPGIALFCLISGPIPMGYSPMLAFEKKAERAAAFAQSTFFTIPIPFEDVMIMLFIAFSSKSIATRSGTIASSITSTFGGSMTMAAVGAVFDKALGLFGMDKESRDRRARSYKDQMLSKSTELSDKEKDAFAERGSKRQNNSNKNTLYDKDNKSQLSTKISETNDLEKISRKKTNQEAADDLSSFKGSPIDQMLSKQDKSIEKKETEQDKYNENIKDKYKKDMEESSNTSKQSQLKEKSQTRQTLQTDKQLTSTQNTEKDKTSQKKLTSNNKQNKPEDSNESDV